MRMRIALLAVLLATPAAAHEVKQGAIVIEHPLMRASLGQVPNTAAYFVLKNTGKAPDRLIGASCACAAKVELHTHAMQGAVAQMRRLDAVTAPPEGEVRFAPGGHHLMLTGLKRPMAAGTMAEVTLRFERAGAVRAAFFVTARVEQELNAYRSGAAHAH